MDTLKVTPLCEPGERPDVLLLGNNEIGKGNMVFMVMHY